MRLLRTRFALAGLSFLVVLATAASAQIPARISDADYWSMITGMSENGGYFRSDNFISNETSFQHVIPQLRATLGTGGVYVGVGPEQNFSYLVALQPGIAFIVDIRRQNMLQHLFYKAMMELSGDRIDFLSRLFSRRRPANVDTASSAAAIAAALAATPVDTLWFRSIFSDVKRQLRDVHHFVLGDSDLMSIEYVHTAFMVAGPDITYSFGTQQRQRFGNRGMPTFAQLMVETDSAGVQRGWLASERNYGVLRDMEMRNLVVPLVGDFGGPKALRAVGNWVRTHGATVSALYTSNVEQYLFMDDSTWRHFYGNVETWPVQPQSTFIRAVFSYGGPATAPVDSSGVPMMMPPRPRSLTVLVSMPVMLQAVRDGRVKSYNDVIWMGR